MINAFSRAKTHDQPDLGAYTTKPPGATVRCQRPDNKEAIVEPQRVVGGRYRLVAKLGSGGMGTVWHAYDERLHREVAIKEIRVPPTVTDEERRDLSVRAMSEARSAARLDHPNIVHVYDAFEDADQTWIVMQLVRGKTLDEVIHTRGRLPPARAAELGLPLLDALDAAHAAGILHRDLKPSNVLLPDTGGVMLTDFSIAAAVDGAGLTRTGVLLGTPGYVAPERLITGRSGPPVDLFGLGATLYFVTEGHRPFERDTPLGELFATVNQPHPEPEHAGPLVEVIDGLLAKDPDDRWTTGPTREALRTVAMRPVSSAPATATAGMQETTTGTQEAPAGTAGTQETPTMANDGSNRIAPLPFDPSTEHTTARGTARVASSPPGPAPFPATLAVPEPAPAAGPAAVPDPAAGTAAVWPPAPQPPPPSPAPWSQPPPGHAPQSSPDVAEPRRFRVDRRRVLIGLSTVIGLAGAGATVRAVLGTIDKKEEKAGGSSDSPAASAPTGSPSSAAGSLPTDMMLVQATTGLESTARTDIYRITPGTGQRTLVVGSGAPSLPQWSRDRSKVAYLNKTGNVWQIIVVNLDGTGMTLVADKLTRETRVSWSLDNRSLAYVAWVNGQIQVLISTLGQTSPTQLTRTAEMKWDPVWAPHDANLMVMSAVRDAFRDIVVMRVDSADSSRTWLTANAAAKVNAIDPNWSPDGRQVAYARNSAQGRAGIRIMNADGSGDRALTSDSELNTDPTWSPDGQWIAFTQHTEPPATHAVRPDGTDLRRLTVGEAGESFACWS
jgi:eukaryotic-like serine/threonine-protein kinase